MPMTYPVTKTSTMSSGQDAFSGALAALIDRGEDRGCLELSEVDEFAQALELEEGDLGGLYEQLDARGIDAARRLRRASRRRARRSTTPRWPT